METGDSKVYHGWDVRLGLFLLPLMRDRLIKAGDTFVSWVSGIQKPSHLGVEKAATVQVQRVSLGHVGLIKVVTESPSSTFEFQFIYEIILFEAVQVHRNECDFLLSPIDFTLIPDVLGSSFESNPPFPCLPSFLFTPTFHPPAPTQPQIPLFLHLVFWPIDGLYITAWSGMEWKPMNDSWFLRQVHSHYPIWKFSVCKHWAAPFLHCSLPSIVPGTLWCGVDRICLFRRVCVCRSAVYKWSQPFCLLANQIKIIHFQIQKRCQVSSAHMLLECSGPLLPV